MKLHPPVLNRKHRATRAGLLCIALLAATAFTAHAQNTGFGTVTPASKVTVKGNFAVGTGAYTTIAAPAFGAIVQGFTGIGIVAPTNQLHVFAAADPVRFEGLQFSTNSADTPLVVQADGVVKKANPASVVLPTEFIQVSYRGTNPAGNIAEAGENIKFGDVVQAVRSPNNLFSVNAAGDTITLKPGRTYKLIFMPNWGGASYNFLHQFYNVTDGTYFGTRSGNQTATYGTLYPLLAYITPQNNLPVTVAVKAINRGGYGYQNIGVEPSLTVETVD